MTGGQAHAATGLHSKTPAPYDLPGASRIRMLRKPFLYVGGAEGSQCGRGDPQIYVSVHEQVLTFN